MGLLSGLTDFVGDAIGGIADVAGDVIGGASKIFGKVGGNVIDGAIDKVGGWLGVDQTIIDGASAVLHGVMGDWGGAIGNGLEAIQGLIAEESATPFQQAHAQQDIAFGQDMLAQAMFAQAKNQGVIDDDGNVDQGKAKNFLEALAEVLGQMVADRANKMMDAAKEMQNLGQNTGVKGGKDGEQGAEELFKANTTFQAESQMFNIVNSAANNALKTLGQGMNTMAGKQ